MSKERKPSRFFPHLLRIVKFFYGPHAVEGLENLPDEPCFIISNHAQIHGPMISQLFMPKNTRTWCAAETLQFKTARPYAFEDFWSGKPKHLHWLYKGLSYLAAPLLVYLHTNGRTIGVYHDHRVMSTFRDTLQYMQEGNHIIIFPEKAEPNNRILCHFQEGFVDAARLLYRRTGRRAAFVPMYIAPSLKKIVLGAPVYYNEETQPEDERHRICHELTEAITALALTLPPHIVTPYMNVSKKDYPMSK